MDIERRFCVEASRERVWGVITSPEDVGPCLPGCEEVHVLGPGRFRAVVGIKIGPISTKFNIDVETLEQRRPEFAAYATRGEEGGRASYLSAQSTITLTTVGEDRTDVRYQSSVTLVGRLSKFAGGLMKKFVESMSDKFIEALRARLAL